MKTLERSILAATAFALLLLFLFPPFMCIDPRSGGRVHAALGHHALWDMPTPEYAFRVLYPNASELPNAERLADFTPRLNRVQLTIYAFAVALAGCLASLLLRRLGRRHRR